MTSKNYKDLIVWQRGVKFCAQIYRVTASFPKEEMFGLVSQLRRAAVSIPSNIAEGQVRSAQAFQNHLSIALGSAAEVETQLLIACEVGHITTVVAEPLLTEVTELIRMIRGLANALRSG